MNKVILGGRLVRDPEIRIAQGKEGNITVASFTLAVNSAKKDAPANFINCSCFGKTAEVCEKFLKRGALIFVEGSWITDSYTNKEGNKVYTNTCSVTSIEFAEAKKEAPKEPAMAPIPDAASIEGFLPFK